jgi:hypothetical protein
VLSHEAILSHVGDDTGWRGPFQIHSRSLVPGWRIAVERLHRLAAVIDHVRAVLDADLVVSGLLTIRRQGPLLASTWAWNYEHYRAMGVDGESDLLDLAAADRFPRLRFGEMAEQMMASGMQEVTVLPLELLQQDPASFWRRVTTLVGVPIGPPSGHGIGVANGRSLTPDTWRTRTVSNRLVAAIGTSRTFDRAIAGAKPLTRGRLEHLLRPRSADGPRLAVSPRFLETLDALHAEANHRLDVETGLGLAELGYLAPSGQGSSAPTASSHALG